ncbi:hypothetical protein [Winogradskyella sp. R77965]|uniref:hypothetical protein n=1 Tax=Winogradskyella sp. R77965 TaxID=3093872 RepID=UPI0037DC61C7
MGKIISSVLILFCIIYSCNSAGNNKAEKIVKEQNISNQNRAKDFVVIEIDSTNSFMFKGLKPAKLNKDEIESIHNIVEACVNAYNDERNYSKDDSEYLSLINYSRQYIAYYNKKGEKEVWANFYSGNLDGVDRKQILIVEDGGNSYFQLNINLDKNKCEDLSVNGVA